MTEYHRSIIARRHGRTAQAAEFEAMVKSARAALRAIGAQCIRVAGSLARALGVHQYDGHHPRPLAIDGRAYHQRRKARARRNRR